MFHGVNVSGRTRVYLKNVFVYFLLIVGAIVFLIPFIWQLSTSLKPMTEVYKFPPTWIPKPALWENYRLVFTKMPYLTFLKNTIIITIICIVGETLSASLVAYSFARLRWPGRDFWFLVLLSTLMIPWHVVMVPQFILFKHLGWIDTFYPLTVPAFFGGGAFFIFLLRQFFLTIPVELEDAAKIDGCSYFYIYSRIILPLARPALIAVAIFSFMNHWNDFMGPLIYINSLDKRTIALGLNYFRGYGSYPMDLNILMAGAFLAMVPCLVIFLLAQKYFIQGVVITGVKG